MKNKKLLNNIIVYLIIIIVAVVLLNWLIKSQQANRHKNEASNFNEYYKELLAKCGQQDKSLYNCCFASVELMAANNYKLASSIGCEPGFKINTYKCLGSYKWCETIR